MAARSRWAAVLILAAAVTWALAGGVAWAQGTEPLKCDAEIAPGSAAHTDAGMGHCSQRTWRLNLEQDTLLEAEARGNIPRLSVRPRGSHIAKASDSGNYPELIAELPAGEHLVELETNGEPFVVVMNLYPVPEAGELELRSSAANPTAGDELKLTLSLENHPQNEEVDVRVWLELPSGTEMARPEGPRWADPECASYCEARFTLSPGERARAEAWVLTRQAGAAEFRAGSVWAGAGGKTRREGRTQTLGIDTLPPPEAEAHMALHASRTQVRAGENFNMRLTIANGADKPEMEALAILKLPEGTSITASGFADSCAGQCSALHRVPPGGQRTISIDVTANQPGQFAVLGELAWSFPSDPRRGTGPGTGVHSAERGTRPPAAERTRGDQGTGAAGAKGRGVRLDLCLHGGWNSRDGAGGTGRHNPAGKEAGN